ncbi:non-specific serine/threonine protein kinase [Ranunculus cassubicifolius]
MSLGSTAVIAGSVSGGFITIIAIIVLLWCCMCKKFANKNSETGSSEPSVLVEWNREGGIGTSSGRGQSPGHQRGRQFLLDELEHATNQFSESNLIGEGSFGLVYKGLLHDGTVVAVKRRVSDPQREFVQEVTFLSEIWHRHLVSLLGYCQDDGFQMLVFEYVPNGSLCDHLHGKSSESQLEFKRRISVALGAGKGLCHLHCLNPPLIHTNFNTSNVLVDENFIAKVSDAGIIKLLERIGNDCHSFQRSKSNVFRDPGLSGMVVTETSDVYSFGIFLLEIISGEDPRHDKLLGSGENLIQQVKSRMASQNMVDSRLDGTFTPEGMQNLINLTLRCLSVSGERRPNMKVVVLELEQLLAKEMTWGTAMAESTAIVTLGSQLFTTG